MSDKPKIITHSDPGKLVIRPGLISRDDIALPKDTEIVPKSNSEFESDNIENIEYTSFTVHNSIIKANFENCKFDDITFSDCCFRNRSFKNCAFYGCEFINCYFDGFTIRNCTFSTTQLTNPRFNQSYIYCSYLPAMTFYAYSDHQLHFYKNIIDWQDPSHVGMLVNSAFPEVNSYIADSLRLADIRLGVIEGTIIEAILRDIAASGNCWLNYIAICGNITDLIQNNRNLPRDYLLGKLGPNAIWHAFLRATSRQAVVMQNITDDNILHMGNIPSRIKEAFCSLYGQEFYDVANKQNDEGCILSSNTVLDIRNFEDPSQYISLKAYEASLAPKTKSETEYTYLITLVRIGTEHRINPEPDITFCEINEDTYQTAIDKARKVCNRLGYEPVTISKVENKRYTIRHARERAINQLLSVLRERGSNGENRQG